jgi:hypothetical protein
VCKVFFLGTLCVSDKMVYYNLTRAHNGAIPKPKKRLSHNRLPSDDYNFVVEHINAFPRIDSHYCRAGSKNQYLESHLSVSEMYRLYIEKCGEFNKKPVSKHMYLKIFNYDFNLAFHVPQKDACDTCTTYDLLVKAGNATGEKIKEHEDHQRRKKQARRAKEEDKKSDPNDTIVAAFDLEQVLTCPKLSVSSAYYLRKLSVYNFTIYELQTHNGHCFVWNESEGKRGSNEITSAMIKWLQEVDHRGVKTVILYSDTCGGQNRNRIMCTALSLFLCKASNIRRIEQKFFESGHSQSECDSMHSNIERRIQKCPVYLPSQYTQVLQRAVRVKTYEVCEMQFGDVFDFERANASNVKSSAFSGIQMVHHIVYEKCLETERVKIWFSNEIGGNLQEKIFMCKNVSLSDVVVQPAYAEKLAIDADKAKDLLKLCQFIQPDCQAFYTVLQPRSTNSGSSSATTRLVVLESGLGLESGLKFSFAELGLGLEPWGLGLGLEP